MKVRALTAVALASLAFSAAGCAAEPASVASNDSALASSVLSNADLQRALTNATKGLEYTSETDAPYDVFVAPGKVGAAIDADAVRSAFNGMRNTHDDQHNLDLKNLPGSEIRDFEEWASSDSKDMSTAYALMRENLTDRKVVLVAAESMKQEENVGFLQVFLVGRAQDGALVALHTIAVWT